MLDLLVYVTAAIVLAEAIFALLSRDNVYAILSLGALITTVAGLFILLSLEFIGLVQIIVYAGTVVILMLFAELLMREPKQRGKPIIEVCLNKREVSAAALSVAILLLYALLVFTLLLGGFTIHRISISSIGSLFAAEYQPLFLVVIVLVGSIIAGSFAIIDLSFKKGDSDG